MPNTWYRCALRRVARLPTYQLRHVQPPLSTAYTCQRSPQFLNVSRVVPCNTVLIVLLYLADLCTLLYISIFTQATLARARNATCMQLVVIPSPQCGVWERTALNLITPEGKATMNERGIALYTRYTRRTSLLCIALHVQRRVQPSSTDACTCNRL